MSPEQDKPVSDVFGRLKHNLLVTRAIDIESAYKSFEKTHGSERTFELSSQGFSLVDMDEFQAEFWPDIEVYDKVQEAMFDTADSCGLGHEWANQHDVSEMQVPFEILFALTEQLGDSGDPEDRKIISFVKDYQNYLANPLSMNSPQVVSD